MNSDHVKHKKILLKAFTISAEAAKKISLLASVEQRCSGTELHSLTFW